MRHRQLAIFAPLLALAALACSTDTCNEQSVEIAYACVPDLAAPDTSLVFEVREACGTYCAREPFCNAEFRGGQVILELRQDRCGDVNPITCASQTCMERIAACEIPRLPEGDYPVIIPGGPSRLLRVHPGGQVTCRIANTNP